MASCPRLDAVPFESERQYMATLHHDHEGHHLVLLKGAAAPVALFALGVTVALRPLTTIPREMPAHLFVKLLLQAAPQSVAGIGKHEAKPATVAPLQGPVVDTAGRTDVVTDQSQVDDLLASLGF